MSTFTKKNTKGIWNVHKDGKQIGDNFRSEIIADAFISFMNKLTSEHEMLRGVYEEKPDEKTALAIAIKQAVREEDTYLVIRFAEELSDTIIKEHNIIKYGERRLSHE